jgi:hypothetical protein
VENKLVTSRMVVYGEGSVAPIFIGSVWMRDEGESMESAERRYSEVAQKMGFDYLGEKP